MFHLPSTVYASIRDETTVAMLLILVLQELAEVAERLGTLRAAVGKVGHTLTSPPAVLEKWDVAHVRPHRILATSEIVDLLPRVVLPGAAAAVSALDVLHGVGPRPEALIPTDRARNGPRAMDLHVHT